MFILMKAVQSHTLLTAIPLLQSAGYTDRYVVVGVYSVEHLGKPARTCDGLLMTVLVKIAVLSLASNAPCEWVELHSDDSTTVTIALTSSCGCAKLFDYCESST